MTKAQFNCSQANFIVVAQTALNSFIQFLKEFSDFSPLYDQAWADGMIADLDAAAALPDEDTRRSESEVMRFNLLRDCRLALKQWQFLKRYISKIFEKELVALKLKAAGANYYSAAANDGWPEALQLFSNGTNFIEANKDKLKGVAPDAFQQNFANAVNQFKKSLQAYEQSKEAIMEGTQLRINALNKVHDNLMPMMLDGQGIFQDNEAVRKQFVFIDVLGRVSGPGLAGIRGTISNIFNQSPIANATITISNSTGKVIATATSDEEGKFLANTPSGTYSLMVAATDFVPRSIENFTVDIGTVSKLDVALSALVVEAEG